ncbi:MAG: hypothetical protein K6U14_01455 [Firmicutes bacterium]|nr:hypothetical protein [Alicyclobacillaceae bacterium]MCL6496286.1 hypothetical protein [Bacillota bacterium]
MNVEQAPPAALVLGFSALGWCFLAAVGVGVARLSGALAAHQFAAFGVLGVVHLFTLGFLTTSMMGTLYQWIPVVFDVPAVPAHLAVRQAAIWLGGVGVFVAGWFSGSVALVAAGGGVAALALLLFTLLVSERMAKSARRRDTIFWTVSASLVGLNLTWVLGLGMALSWNTPAVGGFVPFWLPLHLATALVGWVGFLVLGVELKLVPMFAMASLAGVMTGGPPALAGLGYLLFGLKPWLGASTGFFAAAAWLGAAVWALGQVFLAITRSRAPGRPDPVFVATVSGWLLWVAAAALSAEAGWAAVALAMAGAGLFLLGYQSRILPFVVALAISRRLPGPAVKAFYLARGLQPVWAPPMAAALWLAMVLGVTSGVESGQAWQVRLGAAFLEAAVVVHVVSLAAMAYARRGTSNALGSREQSPGEAPRPGSDL